MQVYAEREAELIFNESVLLQTVGMLLKPVAHLPDVLQ